MRLILAAALAFVPVAFAQHGHTLSGPTLSGPTGSDGNVLHPGVPSPGALRAPAPIPRPGSFGRIGNGRIGNGGRRAFGGNSGYIPYPIYRYGFGFDNFYP